VSRIVPNAPELARETLIVLGGALLAALIVGNIPSVRNWIKRQWGDTPRPF
jgi:hypothetical protein